MASEAASGLKPHSYVNITVNESGEETINFKESPEHPGSTPRCRPYVNVPLVEPGKKDNSRLLQKEPCADCTDDQTHSPKNTKEGSQSHNSPNVSPLRRHLSEIGSRGSRKGLSGDARDGVMLPSFVSDSSPISTEQAIANAKLRVLIPQGAAQGKGCAKCEDLMDLLATWQIGAGSLTRNYSRILALLTQTRDSAIALECRLSQQASAPPSTTAGSNTTSGLPSEGTATSAGTPLRYQPAVSRIPKNRQSMYVNNSGMALAAASCRDHDLAENMYPSREDSVSSTPNSAPGTINSATYAKDLKDLKAHLWDAIDLCQQLAAACFKNTHLSNSPSSRGNSKSPSHSSPSSSSLSQLPDPLSNSTPSSDFVRKHSTGMTVLGSNYKPSLQSITEARLSESRKRQRTLERVPSAPSLECSTENRTSYSSGDIHSDPESDFVTVSPKEIPDSVTKATVLTTNNNEGARDGVTKRGHMIDETATDADQSGQESDATAATDAESGTLGTVGSSARLEHELSHHPTPKSSLEEDHMMTSMSLSSEKLMMVNGRTDSVLSSMSTYSDSDVKYVMTKIASLEEERYGLLETIDQLHTENSTVSLEYICILFTL